MTIQEVLNKATLFLQNKGYTSARLDAEILLSHCLGIDKVKLYINYSQDLNEDELKKFYFLLSRRASGEPIAYLIGYKEFWSVPIKVDRNVLIPRPETEVLVEEAIRFILSSSISKPKAFGLPLNKLKLKRFITKFYFKNSEFRIWNFE